MPLDDEQIEFKFTNSCNGIVGLFSRHHDPMYLYQPLTGEFMTVPDHVKCLDGADDRAYHQQIGLGYEPNKKLFKLTRFYNNFLMKVLNSKFVVTIPKIIVKGEEIVDLECIFTISVNKRMFSLNEI
jgi:hypothetical protein